MSYQQAESSGSGSDSGSGKGKTSTKEAGVEGSQGGGGGSSAVYSPGGAPIVPSLPSDELVSPETFFTYHIVFVPDLSQKYGLKIKGGVGEIRAAMNLVNGWMFTGLGPYYMKDSSTAQNLIAGGIGVDLAGRGVAQVIKSIADLKGLPGARRESGVDERRVAPLISQIRQLNLSPQPIIMSKYAEIYIYEPTLNPDGSMSWNRVIDHTFDREILGTVSHTVIQGNPEEVVGMMGGSPQTPEIHAQGQGRGGSEAPAAPSTENTPQRPEQAPRVPRTPSPNLPSTLQPGPGAAVGPHGAGGDTFARSTAVATRRVAEETKRLERPCGSRGRRRPRRLRPSQDWRRSKPGRKPRRGAISPLPP